MIMSESYKKSLKMMTDALNFLMSIAGQIVRQNDVYDVRRVDSYNLLDGI